jgi:hypothetical protein
MSVAAAPPTISTQMSPENHMVGCPDVTAFTSQHGEAPPPVAKERQTEPAATSRAAWRARGVPG